MAQPHGGGFWERQAKEVTKLIYGYVDDMLSDFFYDKEEELRDEISADIAREGQEPLKACVLQVDILRARPVRPPSGPIVTSTAAWLRAS